MHDTDRQSDWCDAILCDGVNTTAWEQEFVESMRDRIDRGLTLSEKQAEILEKIYAERTP